MSHEDVMRKLNELHSKVISYVLNSNNTEKKYTACEQDLKEIKILSVKALDLANSISRANIDFQEKNNILNDQIIKLQETNEFLNLEYNELTSQNKMQCELIAMHIVSDDNKKNDYIKKLKKENSNLLVRLDYDESLKLKNTELQKRINLYEKRLADQEITIKQFDNQILRLQDFNLQQINIEHKKQNFTELQNDYEILLLENESLNNFIGEQTEQMTQLNSIIERFKQVYNTTQQSSTPLSTNSNINKSYTSTSYNSPPYNQGTPSTPPP